MISVWFVLFHCNVSSTVSMVPFHLHIIQSWRSETRPFHRASDRENWRRACFVLNGKLFEVNAFVFVCVVKRTLFVANDVIQHCLWPAFLIELEDL